MGEYTDQDDLINIINTMQNPINPIWIFLGKSLSIIPSFGNLQINWQYLVRAVFQSPLHESISCDCFSSLLADCLNSLALVANEAGYVKPKFVDDDIVDIVGGRHPMVEALRSDPFVPNDIFLGDGVSRLR